MRFGVPLLAAAAAALVLAATAGASGTHGITKHDRDVIRFFEHHPRLAATPAGGRVLAHLLPRVMNDIRSLQAAKLAAPAHVLLWKCIAGYPGFRPGGGPGESWGNNGAVNGQYTGILQMHPDWGYGIHGNASSYSPLQVMQAAERGYAASGYSQSFLISQWAATVGPCWQFA